MLEFPKLIEGKTLPSDLYFGTISMHDLDGKPILDKLENGKLVSYPYSEITQNDDLILFLTHGWMRNGADELLNSAINTTSTSKIWEDLKSYAKNIFFHIGDPFPSYSFIAQNLVWAFVKEYTSFVEDECVKYMGKNYVESFMIPKSVLYDYFKDILDSFNNVYLERWITLSYSRPKFYQSKENPHIFKNVKENVEILENVEDCYLLIKWGDNSTSLQRVSLPNYVEGIPKITIDPILSNIISSVAWSCSSGVSITSLYKRFRNSTFENCGASGEWDVYKVEGKKMMVKSFRCDIDDYAVVIKFDGVDFT